MIDKLIGGAIMVGGTLVVIGVLYFITTEAQRDDIQAMKTRTERNALQIEECHQMGGKANLRPSYLPGGWELVSCVMEGK